MSYPCVLRTAARAALSVAFGLGLAAPASAHTNGQILASGKNGGFYCRNCHVGGAVPAVAFDGPNAVEPGAMATFRFTVTSRATEQTAAGLDVATDGGTLGLVEGQGTRLQGGEVTHTAPKANDANGEAAFELTWQAPETPGTYTLYGAGCSVNGNSLQNGDAAARTTLQIFVGVETPTSTPTPELPTATPSPTSTITEVPTPGDQSCAGDCNSNAQVTVDELVTGVNIALGVSPPSACPAFDADGDGEVAVNEIVQAVNNALNGCPLP